MSTTFMGAAWSSVHSNQRCLGGRGSISRMFGSPVAQDLLRMFRTSPRGRCATSSITMGALVRTLPLLARTPARTQRLCSALDDSPCSLECHTRDTRQEAHSSAQAWLVHLARPLVSLVGPLVRMNHI